MPTVDIQSNRAIVIGGQRISPGERRSLDLPVVGLPTGSSLTLPIQVLCGVRSGPAIWLSATTHGEELNGLEIIHRVLQRLRADQFAGTLIAAPVMNVLGFMTQKRTLPDGSDLNRTFPGSPRGSVAERLADFFMREVVMQCDYGIDLHSGANNRINPPQIRADLHDPETRRLVEAFAPPVFMNAPVSEGSLRNAAAKNGKRVLLFEGGEPLRFDDVAINAGEAGVLRVLRKLGMTNESTERPAREPMEVGGRRKWAKAPRCGIWRAGVDILDEVHEGQTLGTVSDVVGDNAEPVVAPFAGIIIGKSLNPFVAMGGGVLHLATRVH